MEYKPKRLQQTSPYEHKPIIKFIKRNRGFLKVVTVAGAVGVTVFSTFLVASDRIEIEKPVETEKIVAEYSASDFTRYTEYALNSLEKNAREIVKKAEEERLLQQTEEERKYIKLYCDIYEINYDKVYKKIADMTNNFTDSNYVSNYVIGESKMKGRHVDCTSKEMAIMLAVRSIYQLPENYGFTNEELKTGIDYTTKMDYSHQIGYVSEVLGVDPALNYAICRTESGFKSRMFLNSNNPSGLRFDGEWAVFPSTMAGFIEQGCELLKYKIDGVETIAGIGAIHAPLSDGNYGWVSNVSSIYDEALENYQELFGNDEKVELAL